MKRLLIFFLFFSLNIQAQEFFHVDNRVRKYPKFTSVQKLASKIKTDFKNDKDKIRAVYIWLTHNIRYDLEEYYNPKNNSVRFRYSSEAEKQAKLKQIKAQIVSTTLKTRKSVCEGYAQAFKAICDSLQIEAAIVSGFARNNANEIGKIPKYSDHAWNVVQLNKQWIIIDATWGAGRVINGKWEKYFSNYFFNISPTKVHLSHYPEEKKWQTIFKYPTIHSYFNQPIYKTQFLSSHTTLIAPLKGTLKVNNKEFAITLKNFRKDQTLLYTYGNARQGRKPKLISDQKITTFWIQKPKKTSQLNIFIDLQLVLVFQIVVD